MDPHPCARSVFRGFDLQKGEETRHVSMPAELPWRGPHFRVNLTVNKSL